MPGRQAKFKSFARREAPGRGSAGCWDRANEAIKVPHYDRGTPTALRNMCGMIFLTAFHSSAGRNPTLSARDEHHGC